MMCFVILVIQKLDQKNVFHIMYFQTGVLYACPPGQAFDGLYTQEEWGNCTGSGDINYWKYNSTNPLPNCIRKCQPYLN